MFKANEVIHTTEISLSAQKKIHILQLKISTLLLYDFYYELKVLTGTGYSSVLECYPSMHESLGSKPLTLQK